MSAPAPTRPRAARAPAPAARPAGADALEIPSQGWPAASPPARTGVRLAAFAALSAFAADRYAALVLAPPAGRVALAVAIAVVLAWVLARPLTAMARSRAPGRTVAALAAAVAIVASLAMALALGVPATLLWPGHWVHLVNDLGHGLGGLAGNLWPYRGTSNWARVTVLLGLVITLVPAAALAFWPARSGAGTPAAAGTPAVAGTPAAAGAPATPAAAAAGAARRRAARRRAGALALLLGVYATAAANEPPDNWLAQGILLLVLVAAWLWLATLRRADAARAAVWVTVAAALAVALSAGLRDAQPWINYRAWQPFGPATPRLSFQWDSTYGPLAWPNSGAVMFRVYAQRPELWTVTTLDRFDGVRFLRSDQPPPTLAGAQPPPNIPGQVGYEAQTFDIVGFVTDLLPAGGQAVDVELLNTSGTESAAPGPDGTIAVAPPGLQQGDVYTVTAYVAHPTPQVLRQAGRSFPAAYLPYTAFDLPTASQSGATAGNLRAAAREPLQTAQTISSPVPGLGPATVPASAARVRASPYARMFELAQRLAAGAPSSYDVALRIEDYLQRNYAYDTTAPARRYPLEAFLFSDREGYCQQFAGAMTLLLRMDGIPAREAVGFEPGRYVASGGDFVVTARDAHAWVQVYFNGLGWIAFDPTPPTTQTVAPATLAAQAAAVANGALSHSRALHQPPPNTGGGPLSGRRAGHGLDPLVALAALGGGALVVALMLALGSLRLARSLTGEADGAVAELRRGLRMLGHPLAPGTTLAQIERRLERTYGPGAGAYPALLRARRFAPPGQPLSDGARERRAMRRSLASGGGAWARAVALTAFPPAAPRRRGREPGRRDAARGPGG